jgi:hypothetical protein
MAESHHFYTALAPGVKKDATLLPMAPTQIHNKVKLLKREF